MLSELVAIASWAFIAFAMLYGARHPERIVRARRCVASQHAVTKEDLELIRIMLGVTILLWIWVGYRTDQRALPLLAVLVAVAAYLPLEIMHRRGGGFFARYVPMRIIGLLPIGFGVREWLSGAQGFAVGFGALGLAFVCFPRLVARASNLGMSEEQEIARTRKTGRIGGIEASLTLLALIYLTISSHLLR